MSNFIKVSEIKEQKLKEEEMKKARGGYLDLPVVLDYGMVDPPW